MPREILLFEISAIFTPFVTLCDHYVTNSYRKSSIYALCDPCDPCVTKSYRELNHFKSKLFKRRNFQAEIK